METIEEFAKFRTVRNDNGLLGLEYRGEMIVPCVIRKSKRSTCEKRNVIFLKTKRTSDALPGTPLFQKISTRLRRDLTASRLCI